MVEKTKEPAQPVLRIPRVNKMNMRRENLKNLLKNHEKNNLTPSANTLRNLMLKNDKHVAGDARSSLNLMRVIFQPDLTREIQNLLDRYTSGTFLPAVMNLEKNGHKVSEDVMKELYANILDEAKKEILKSTSVKMEPVEIEMQSQQGNVMRQLVQSDDAYYPYYAQPTQPLQQIPPHQQIQMNQQRVDYSNDIKPMARELRPDEVALWKPERFTTHTHFITLQRVAQLLGLEDQQVFNNYSMMFRYVCDVNDIHSLMEDNMLPQGTQSCKLTTLEEAQSLAISIGRPHDLQQYSIRLNEQMVEKVQRFAQPNYKRLCKRLQPVSVYNHQHQQSL